jgi:hypothetical protein
MRKEKYQSQETEEKDRNFERIGKKRKTAVVGIGALGLAGFLFFIMKERWGFFKK